MDFIVEVLGMKPDKELYQFCKNIFFLRKKYGYSQNQMASIMKVSLHTLQRIESGDVPNRLLVDVFTHLASFFNCRISDLFIPMGEGEEYFG
ncbi:MAG: hypothetical protein DBX52_00570 [Clostridiales bacterium]|nr:MAG: hypothetical protein DBX52_00570 [Clostridiales bacterium]